LQYSRKKEPESPRGGTATNSTKPNPANLHLDTRLSSSNGNVNYPSPYATLGSASSSKAGPTGSSTALNNGYGTIRKAGLPSPASTSRPTTDSVTYVHPRLAFILVKALLSVG
jgi:hypothetical protein